MSQDGGTFLRNVWPMYVHELSGFGSDFYHLDAVGRWQPDIVEQWIARITPADNLRDVRSKDHAEQPFQRGHVIRVAAERVGFVCVGVRPFRYMPDSLDYTIARITNPTDKPATGRIRSGFLGHDKVASAMSRADIAAFLVSQLTDDRYRRAMPAISN